MPRNRAKRDAKNSRSAERGCSSVLTPPSRRRMVGARNPAPPLAGYAAQSRKARCKKQPERRARLFLCPHAAEQAANGWSPQPCPTTSRLCRAIAQSAMQKTAGALSEAVPLSSRRRTGGERMEPATLPYHEQAMPRNRAKRDAKNSRSAERGCSFALPPPNRRRMIGARNLAPPRAGYAAQSRSDAQTALLPKTQPAAPYAAETSRYVPPLYTYPTKFMHNLCHIVM